MFVTIPKIKIDSDIVWHGTDEQIEEYEKECAACENSWRKIIEDPDVSAFGFQYGTDYHIVSRSTDENGKFRLTYFWNGKKPNGKVYVMDPTMHEYYSGRENNYKGSQFTLLFILSGFCHKDDIIVEIA